MILPIVNTISFSALSNWQYCTYYHKLVNIEKLKPFESNVYTHWGTLVHKYLQVVLLGEMDPLDAAEKLKRTWEVFCHIFKEKEAEKWAIRGARAVFEIKSMFQKEFGNYKVLQVEERLSVPVPEGEKYPQRFKGFIDIVIELEDGRVVIIDFKTCKSLYLFNKFRNKYKDYQLTLYKHFYIEKYEIQDLTKTIETYFVTIERTGSSKKPIGFVRVTSGPKKVENALRWLINALDAINNSVFLKNRMSCHKYSNPGVNDDRTCVFFKTKHCS